MLVEKCSEPPRDFGCGTEQNGIVPGQLRGDPMQCTNGTNCWTAECNIDEKINETIWDRTEIAPRDDSSQLRHMVAKAFFNRKRREPFPGIQPCARTRS